MNAVLLIIIKYKYALLVPLGFIEGHIVSLIVGFLARSNSINPFFGGLCIAAGNLLGDVVLYWLGYHHGKKATTWVGSHIGLTEQSIDRGHDLLRTHKMWILLISKLTNGFGFAMGILFSAGAARIKFRSFMFWNLIGELLWTGLLISTGYFFGELYFQIGSTMTKIFLITGSMGIIATLFIVARRKIRSVYIKNI